MRNRLWGYFKGLGIAIGGAVALFPNSATQAEQKVTNSENLQQLFANSTTQAEHKVTNSENLQQLFAYSAIQAEQKVTSSENLQQLQDELNKEFMEGLKNSQLVEGLQKILQEHGIEGHHVLQLQLMLDLTKLQFNDTSKEQQFKEFLQTNQGESVRPVVQLGVCTSCNWKVCG
jgi:hypothetical protein